MYVLFSFIVNSTPSLKDLHQHITTDYAAKWKIIGRQLGLAIKDLVVIESGYSASVKCCCNQMLKKWLEVDTTASWAKMLAVIKSPAVSSTSTSDKGNYHCIIMYMYCKLEITNECAYHSY